MKTVHIMLASILLFSAAPAGAGEYTQITKQQFNKILPGKTIKGEYRFMRERTKTYNFSETHNKDGSTRYIEGDVRENGLWFTVGEKKICYKYPGSPIMGGTHCFWVYLSEGCYYGYGLSEMTLKQRPRRYEDWEARWIIEGSGGSCDTPVS